MNYPTARIENLCKAVNVGHVGPSSMHRDPNGVPFLMGKNVGVGSIITHNLDRVTEGFHRSQPKSQIQAGDVIVVRIGKSGQAAKVPETLGQANCSGLVIIKQPLKVDADFLVYFLNSPIGRGNSVSQARGSTRMTLNTESVASALVPVPPLPEQHRIVGLLDEAFEGLATAKANAEKNLHNAFALFDSYLQSVFTQRGKGWVRTTIGDQVRLQRGFDITKDQQNEGDVPVVSSGGIKSFHDKAMVQGPGVVIGRKGTLGKVFYFENDFWPHDTTLWVKDFKGNVPRFVYYLFTGLDVKSLDSGTANPALNRNQVHPIEVDWPPVTLQKALVATLDELSAETQRLESLYQQKLAVLEVLMKSLLHQAFTGEL